MAVLNNLEQTKNTQKNVLDRKLSTPYQQNLIELIGYIYQEPKVRSTYSLAHEFQKNGIENPRKILRMIEDINAFCPYIRRFINNSDGRTYYYLDNGRFSETDLDNFFKKSNNAPLLYIFLKSLLVKPMTTSEIMEKVNVNRKTANAMIEKILDATYHVDTIEIREKETLIGGYLNFISKMR